MRKVTYDEGGNIVAIYGKDDEVEGILIDEETATRITENPLGFKVENGELIETGYVPEVIEQPNELEELKQENEMLKERLDSAEYAIISLMDFL